MKKPTIADVAEKAGVSKPTVSRYLKQENVKPQIAEKIQAAIDELGYVPKGASVKEETLFSAPEKKEPVKKEEVKKPKAKAKKSVEKKGYKLALLTKDLSDYRTRTMLKYLQQTLSAAGCMLQIVMTEGKEELEEQYLTTFIVQNVNGILIESCSSAEFIMKQLRTTAIPYVFLRSHMEGNDVAMDEVHAANLLAKYLLDKQHLIIRYLGSDEELTKDHLEGIRNAYHALNMRASGALWVCFCWCATSKSAGLQGISPCGTSSGTARAASGSKPSAPTACCWCPASACGYPSWWRALPWWAV